MPRVQLETGQIIEFENTPSQEDIEEIVGQINTKPISPEPMVGSVFGKVPLSKYQAGERNILGNIVDRPSSAIRSTIAGEGYTKGSNIISPTIQETNLNAFWQDKEPTILNIVKGMGVSAAGKAADIVTDPTTLLGMVAGKLPIGGGKTIGNVIMQTKPMQTLKNIGNTPIQNFIPTRTSTIKNIKVDSLIDKAISKAIRPSVSGKMNSSQIENYYSKARQGVKTILNNKDNLQFFDEAGQPINKLPESLKDFSSAIEQTKNKLWSEIDSLAQQTEKQGVGINTNNVTNELNKITSNRMLRKLHPDVVQYAKKQIEAYNSLGKITPSEAQAEIKNLNDSLTSFYRNPSFDTARKAQIDALIANNLRRSLDDTITSFTGKQYQPLRNDYAALKTIESDVNRRAIIDARKNIKGLIDFSDIISGGDMAQGILSLNPSLFATGVVKKSIASYIKLINDPNNIIKNMFRLVDRVNSMKIIKP